MEDFKLRLINEEKELSQKIEGLFILTTSDKFVDSTITELQKTLLKEQLKIMIKYQSILRNRMIDLGIYKIN